MIQIACPGIVLALILFRLWRIRSGRYERIRLNLRDRFLWAMICALFLAVAFTDRPTVLGAALVCLVFFTVLLCGSANRRISERVDGEGLGSAGAPPSPSS
jgi:hypothetical protein